MTELIVLFFGPESVTTLEDTGSESAVYGKKKYIGAA
jgi:hypothetical protein